MFPHHYWTHGRIDIGMFRICHMSLFWTADCLSERPDSTDHRADWLNWKWLILWLAKEELLYMIIGDLVAGCSQPVEYEQIDVSDVIKRACEYIERHYASNISLCDLSSFTGFSKYHFIRMFTKERGYLLIALLNVQNDWSQNAEGRRRFIKYYLSARFSSQSHFTNFSRNTPWLLQTI